jgi:hypothetical protein
MIVTDLWSEASRDTEAEEMVRRLTAARVAAAEVWPFLAEAETVEDFVNRKALVAERLDHVVSVLHPNEPVEFSVVRASLEASLDEDFRVLHQARLGQQAEEVATRRRIAAEAQRRQAVRTSMAREAEVRQRVEAENRRRQAQRRTAGKEVIPGKYYVYYGPEDAIDNYHGGPFNSRQEALHSGASRYLMAMDYHPLVLQAPGEAPPETKPYYCPACNWGLNSEFCLGCDGRAIPWEQGEAYRRARGASRRQAAKYDVSMVNDGFGTFGFPEEIQGKFPTDQWRVEENDGNEYLVVTVNMTDEEAKALYDANPGIGIRAHSDSGGNALASRRTAAERRVDEDPETGEWVGSEWEEGEDPEVLVQASSTFGKNPRFATQEEAEAWKAGEAEEADTTKADADPKQQDKDGNPFAKKQSRRRARRVTALKPDWTFLDNGRWGGGFGETAEVPLPGKDPETSGYYVLEAMHWPDDHSISWTVSFASPSGGEPTLASGDAESLEEAKAAAEEFIQGIAGVVDEDDLHAFSRRRARRRARRQAATSYGFDDPEIQSEYERLIASGMAPDMAQEEALRNTARRRAARRRTAAEGGSTCSVCGDSIQRDPEGEENRSWHHDNGESHDHEAKPSGDSGDSKESSRRQAVDEQAGLRRHKLLTADLRKRLPALYSTESVPASEKMLLVKFFTPFANWTWYATEFDGEDTFFGYVVGLANEWGYFSLSELESLSGMGGAPGVERDLYWTPITFGALQASPHLGSRRPFVADRREALAPYPTTVVNHNGHDVTVYAAATNAGSPRNRYISVIVWQSKYQDGWYGHEVLGGSDREAVKRRSAPGDLIMDTQEHEWTVTPARKVVFASQHEAANPYSPQGNPYVPPPVTPGTPDDVLDGPHDPNPLMLDMPMTSRPRTITPDEPEVPQGRPASARRTRRRT